MNKERDKETGEDGSEQTKARISIIYICISILYDCIQMKLGNTVEHHWLLALHKLKLMDKAGRSIGDLFT